MTTDPWARLDAAVSARPAVSAGSLLPSGDVPGPGLPVSLYGRHAVIGPVGTSPCRECLTRRWLAVRPGWLRDALELGGGTIAAGEPPQWSTAFSTDAIAALAAHLAAGAPRVVSWPRSLATEDVAWFAAAGASLHGGTAIRLSHWMLGTVSPKQWARAAAGTAALGGVPVNHSSAYAPDPRGTLSTGIAALVLAARAQLDR